MSSTPETVGILSWDYMRPKGGMGVSLRMIAEQLREGGVAVRSLSPSPDDQGDLLLRFTRSVGGHLLFSLFLPLRLGAILRRASVQLLLLPVGPGGVFLLRRPAVPVVAIAYHTYRQQARAVPGERWKRLFIPLERRTLRMAERVLCFCEDTHRVLTREYGLTRVTLLPHAVPPREPAPYKRSGEVVCVARLEPRKGLFVLLEAWPRVRARVPHARLTVVGRGADEAAVDRFIARLEGVSRVSDLTRSVLDDLVARAEVAVCPAYLEGFGLAAAEAMASGTAVVASDVDGLRSLVEHERTGLLVPAGDADALVEAIVRVLTDDALRDRLSSDGRERMRRMYDPAVAARAIVDVVRGFAYAVADAEDPQEVTDR